MQDAEPEWLVFDSANVPVHPSAAGVPPIWYGSSGSPSRPSAVAGARRFGMEIHGTFSGLGFPAKLILRTSRSPRRGIAVGGPDRGASCREAVIPDQENDSREVVEAIHAR